MNAVRDGSLPVGRAQEKPSSLTPSSCTKEIDTCWKQPVCGAKPNKVSFSAVSTVQTIQVQQFPHYLGSIV